MPGYSGTPLWKKLGYADGTRAWVRGEPADYTAMLGLPSEVRVEWLARARRELAFAHIFETEAAKLASQITTLRNTIAPNGIVWVSWPKKASGVATDITEDRIRDIALPMGFVDIKVCAVDETWSGLKLVIRKSER
ncbi:MAG TPA: hypothetical protein VMM36_06475 [Opitutaceae bacterium]|nr:hypothetical protein [Opitutaceae bacterium]